MRSKRMSARVRHAPVRSIASIIAVVACSSAARAATLPTGFQEKLVAGGLGSPTSMALAPDGRIFVCDQGGRLLAIKDGTLLARPFLTLSVDATGERGLLGAAFDPDFARNQRVYVYYTANSPTVHNRLSRLVARGDAVVAGSEEVLLDLPTLGSTHHNGGGLHFGPDGKAVLGRGRERRGRPGPGPR